MRDIADIERELAEKRAELRRLQSTQPSSRDFVSSVYVIAVLLGFAIGFATVIAYRSQYPERVMVPRHDC